MQTLLEARPYITASEYAAIRGVEPSTITRRCLMDDDHPLKIRAEKRGKEWAIPRREIARLEKLHDVQKRAATLGAALSDAAAALYRTRKREWAEQMHAAQTEAANRNVGSVAWSRATSRIGELWEQRREWMAVHALELALLREAHSLSSADMETA